MTAAQLFPNTFWTTPLDRPGRPRTIINDANGYPQKLANQATRTATATPSNPVTGWYSLGRQTISVDYTSAVMIYWVQPGAPTFPVVWKTGSPSAAASVTLLNGLQELFKAVPIPVDQPMPSAGTDKPLIIIERGTGRCWAFWEFSWDPANLNGQCLFGEHIPNVFSHPGVLPHGWGVSASGLPLAAGMIRMAEFRDYLQTGAVPCHPIRIQVPDTTGTHIPPAVRNDAVGGPHNVQGSAVDEIPEGLWVALPAGYEPPAGLTAFQTMTQQMATQNGMVVCDATGGTVNIVLEDHHTQGSGYCEVPDLLPVVWPTPGFWDPYLANATDGQDPWNSFPWTLLQQVAPPTAT